MANLWSVGNVAMNQILLSEGTGKWPLWLGEIEGFGEIQIHLLLSFGTNTMSRYVIKFKNTAPPEIMEEMGAYIEAFGGTNYIDSHG